NSALCDDQGGCNADTAGTNSTVSAGADPQASTIVIDAQGDVQAGDLIAQAGIEIRSRAGNVVLNRGLGGLETGYREFELGYQAELKPNVGRLTVNAARSVEINGLNLDGNADPYAPTPGLSVTAGDRIISNNEIGVNKGDIQFTVTGSGATDGIYLGN